ncbi:MAG: hypothetical protein Q4G28_04030 [Neisseria sp.]|nr:hypothetical protein [Neisseria sp.]
MLTIRFQNRSYPLPLAEGGLAGFFTLDENWRELDYRNGGHALSLDLHLAYRVPPDAIDDFYHFYFINLEERIDGYVVDAAQPPLLMLELAINHSGFDIDTQRTFPRGNLPLFPTLNDLAGQTLSPSVLAHCGLFFPSFASPVTLDHIRFGQASANAIDICVGGSVADTRGKLTFELDEAQIPFDFYARINGDPGEFAGFNIEQRFAEIEACFASLYDISAYEARRSAIQPQHQGMRVSFVKKP